MRVSAAWAGNQPGAMHLPRIGEEVLVDFLGGDPDLPFVKGRLFNALNMPPWSLPEQQALSGFRSRELVPGGGNSAAGRKDHRGEGFELCTDGHGVLRAKDGLLITTEARTSISSNKSFLVSAKEAVRLFAYKSGIKLVSAAADIETQALEKSIHIKTLRSQHGLQASQVFKGQMADG